MSDPLGRWFPALDPVTGMFTLPLWIAGALAALLVVFCILAFNRAGREGMAGVLARVSLVLLAATATWFILESMSTHRVNAERQALDARASELAARGALPGSALACLDAIAGDMVEGSCEKALFQTPAAAAAAVSYVSAQVALLTDATNFIRRGNAGYEPMVAGLRRAVEVDRYGIVAHVLATLSGCTDEKCDALAIMKDASRVRAHLTERPFDSYIRRHASVWPVPAPSPVAQQWQPGRAPGAPALSSLPGAASSYAARAPGTHVPGAQVPGAHVFFPSADSIPAVSIMTSEPPVEPEATTGSATQEPAAARRPQALQKPQPVPARRPPQASVAPPPTPAPGPIDLNAAARSAPTGTAAQ
ncbi:MAG: hypothetical protein ACRECO_09055 [Xanthobacteraceae bacterium]